ncbi:hypothetical protein MKW98_021637 [Papaver atlanticum]|uniref:Neprosin PEP catalytic domain-containing protein n=1 Tax=Papaver atlanticum TaxID=357466 RepID=A0AAD4XV90_9MAGN|nr:hypothetical protein MKW98_021637 [Papaver atlanticum]
MSNFINLTRCLIFSILSFGLSIHELVESKTVSNADASIIKTIKSNNGEIIDCYNIYRQPAFSSPLFRNHKIQMRPSSYPKGIQLKDHRNLKLIQTWHKYGLCQDGTISIRRPINYQPNLTFSSRNCLPSQGVNNTNEDFAAITPVGDNFQGGQADINIWNPLTEQPKEYRTSLIWISGGNNQEVIEAGLEVNKVLYGHDQPSIFVYWTADGYNSTGCYNIQCSGFVQTTSEVAFGSKFDHISIFNGDQFAALFIIFRERSTGDWWLLFEETIIGYWPHFLFKQLPVRATVTAFGGQILNTQPNGRHTKTQMGSGNLPAEGGLGISSFFHRVKVFDGNFEYITPERVSVVVTKAGCYGLKLDQADSSGVKFYYGGPGFSSTCQ